MKKAKVVVHAENLFHGPLLSSWCTLKYRVALLKSWRIGALPLAWLLQTIFIRDPLSLHSEIDTIPIGGSSNHFRLSWPESFQGECISRRSAWRSLSIQWLLWSLGPHLLPAIAFVYPPFIRLFQVFLHLSAKAIPRRKSGYHFCNFLIFNIYFKFYGGPSNTRFAIQEQILSKNGQIMYSYVIWGRNF
jgi:hypothetical protein